MSKREDFSQLLSTPEPAELGPGPRSGVRSEAELEGQLERLLEGSTLSEERRQLVRGLILLWHDHLDAAHEIAQSIDNPDGAFVHGIMHRREPDFSNAAYWFRRVGPHPAFTTIADQLAGLLKASKDSSLGSRLVRGNNWDPFAFIHACEEASGKDASQEQLLRQIQRIETEALLNSFLT